MMGSESSQVRKKYCVLDTSSLIKALRKNVLSEGCIYVLPTNVLNEIKDAETRYLLDANKRFFSILGPSKRNLERVLEVARDLGLSKILSETDISVVATALELIERGHDVIVYTEDYAIQNICAFMKIKFRSVLNRKIKVILRVLKKCKVCGELYPEDLSECPFCGSKEYVLERRRISRLNTN